jgi:hypothetical protein
MAPFAFSVYALGYVFTLPKAFAGLFISSTFPVILSKMSFSPPRNPLHHRRYVFAAVFLDAERPAVDLHALYDLRPDVLDPLEIVRVHL